MECFEVVSTMHLVVDGEASTAVAKRFTRHVESCQECQRRYWFERQLKRLIERACQCVDCPEGFEERIRAAILAELDRPND